ncbi:MAG TPA: hypothetical protein VK436_03945 [Methanocella sp.]|nr:hypothetical protein [Methanocella sp.]
MSDMSTIATSPILVLLGLLLLARIAMGQLSERSRKVSMLWVTPVLMLYISYAAIEQGILSTYYATILLLPAIAVGGLIGFFRGIRVSVKLGEKSGTILVKGSILSLIIWGTMLAIRFLSRYATGNLLDNPMAMGAVTALIVLSMSNTIFYCGYLYYRYFNLLKENMI